ncbi:type II secretion system protein [Planococcus sp. ISL-110]|uniref:type II secretion system protein n=1 Tax=Planococcus sp. ISL-110 TaxID=2819167 RepID=UPI001BEBFB31|nr:type II secretion system protein [Planococcus sp. ISL-110]MBT2569228.1 type II secretion system protein [Planococcus sp. ISL-110]
MKNEKGITLVELLAVLAITGIIVVVIMSVFSTGANSSERTASRQQLQQEANLIVEQIRASYLENEKSDLVAEQFKVKVVGDELKITSIDNVEKKTISTGYQYKLAETAGIIEITLDRTEPSRFYLEICSNNQCFEVQMSFSKLN